MSTASNKSIATKTLSDKDQAILDFCKANPDVTTKAMVALLAMQDEDERTDAMTKVKNRRGFTTGTAKKGTIIARKVLEGAPLSQDELDTAAWFSTIHKRQVQILVKRFGL